VDKLGLAIVLFACGQVVSATMRDVGSNVFLSVFLVCDDVCVYAMCIIVVHCTVIDACMQCVRAGRQTDAEYSQSFLHVFLYGRVRLSVSPSSAEKALFVAIRVFIH